MSVNSNAECGEREQYQQSPRAHRGSRRPRRRIRHEGGAKAAALFRQRRIDLPDHDERDGARLSHPDRRPSRAPRLRMQLVDRPEHRRLRPGRRLQRPRAGTCKSSTPIRTVTLDAAAGKPDVTVNLSADAKAARLQALCPFGAVLASRTRPRCSPRCGRPISAAPSPGRALTAPSPRRRLTPVNHPANRTAGLPVKGKPQGSPAQNPRGEIRGSGFRGRSPTRR